MDNTRSNNSPRGRRRTAPLVWGGVTLLVLAAVSAAVFSGFRSDMAEQYARIAQGFELWESPEGTVQYARREGQASLPPVLVVHGSGGGFDQGSEIAGLLIDGSRGWVAPSRFGYLRSSVPKRCTARDQAEVLFLLMAHLGYSRFHVLAMSAGGAAGVELALAHPEAVLSLTLLSAGVSPQKSATQTEANGNGDALSRIVSGDFPYWLATHLLRRQMIGFIGVPAPVFDSMDKEEQGKVLETIEIMNPASERARGIGIDRAIALPGNRMAGVRVPTLIFHASDDKLQVPGNANDAHRLIPGSRLVNFDRGGHLALVVHRRAIGVELGGFLGSHDRH
jgi:2-hydroxy-6-oxonona-2,4-dienedioate hydrolase